MEWTYNDKKIDETTLEQFIGFVYLITNKITHRKYIGKKLLQFSRTKQVKGKKKRIKVDSDWKTYYGSNKELQEDVVKLGEENFTREILRFCKRKGECSYYEAKFQFENDVLLSDDWYNSFVGCRIHKIHMGPLLHSTNA